MDMNDFFLLLQVDHEAGQGIPVRQRQLTDSLIQQGQAVAIILGFYKQIYITSSILKPCVCRKLPN